MGKRFCSIDYILVKIRCVARISQREGLFWKFNPTVNELDPNNCFYEMDWGDFSLKISWSPKKKAFSGQNQKFKVFFWPETDDLQKKVFAKIQKLFLADIKKFKVFFRPKTGDLQKKTKKKVFADGWSVFFSASLCTRNLVLYSTGLCRSFFSHQPELKSR